MLLPACLCYKQKQKHLNLFKCPSTNLQELERTEKHGKRHHWNTIGKFQTGQRCGFFFLLILFIYFWLSWVFIAVCRLLIAVTSLVASRVQAQQLWLAGLVALRHVGSSWTRAGTHVACIGRRILNHRATRAASRFQFQTTYQLLTYTSPYVPISQY